MNISRSLKSTYFDYFFSFALVHELFKAPNVSEDQGFYYGDLLDYFFKSLYMY